MICCNMTSKKLVRFHLLFFLFHLCLQGDAGKTSTCRDARCGKDGPAIRFPFWLKGQQPENCGYPGFELSCSHNNQTLIQLPSTSGQFIVTAIDYLSQNIDITDPGGCIARRLIGLDVTGSPFMILWSQNFTLLRCSSRVEGREQASIDCLSSSTHHVYAVHASETMTQDQFSYCSNGFIANIEASVTIPYNKYYVPDLEMYLELRCHSYECPKPEYSFVYPSSSQPILSSYRCPRYVIFEDYLTSLYNFTRLSWTVTGCDGCEWDLGICQLKSNTSRERECFVTKTNYPTSPFSLLPNQEELPAKPTTIKRVCIGIALASFFLALIVTLILVYVRSRRAEAETNRKKINKFLEDRKSLNPARYSFSDVKKMTKEFGKKLGQGGYGTVFKGELENGIPVAVKVLNNSKGNGEDFTNEVSTIGRIHHINVVRLLGYCVDGSNRALVYEYMRNKSLDKFIFAMDSKRAKLSWGKLRDIAIGVARGIEYLHQGCDLRILHFDIKPQNVLLDMEFNPKISDFGLAKLCPKKESVVPITAVRGTMGYIAPEVYFSGNNGNVSYKTDVYSFGMLLFEMVGGRKNKDPTVENASQVYFPQWVYNRLANGEDLGIKEEKDGDGDIANKLSIVALWCVQWEPSNRPSITTVIQMLEGRTGSLAMPSNPFASLASEESDGND